MRIHELSPKLAALMARNRIPANVPVYIIDAIGLSEDHLDVRFPQELVARREWIAENCYGAVEIEPIREQMRLVGRRFRFESLADATYFKLRWGAEVR